MYNVSGSYVISTAFSAPTRSQPSAKFTGLITVLLLLGATIVMFAWHRPRLDVLALIIVLMMIVVADSSIESEGGG